MKVVWNWVDLIEKNIDVVLIMLLRECEIKDLLYLVNNFFMIDEFIFIFLIIYVYYIIKYC